MALLQHSVSSSSCLPLLVESPVIRRTTNCLSMALSAHPSPTIFSQQLPENHRLAVQPANSPVVARCQHSSSMTALEEKPPVVRRQGNFHQTLWDDQVIESLTTYDKETTASFTQRIGELKDKVQYILSHSIDRLEMINLIDTIEFLELDNHFEREIEATLEQLYKDGDVV